MHIFKSFKKENKEIVDNRSCKTKRVDYLTVISGNSIAEMDIPPFGEGKWESEKRYKMLMEEMQPMFEEFKKKGLLDTTYPLNGSVEEISLYNLRQKCVDLFISDSITTIKTKSNEYKVASNGRHRMFVAKKYGFDILIHVNEEEI